MMLSTPSSTPTARSCPDLKNRRYSIPHRAGMVDPGNAWHEPGGVVVECEWIAAR